MPKSPSQKSPARGRPRARNASVKPTPKVAKSARSPSSVSSRRSAPSSPDSRGGRTPKSPKSPKQKDEESEEEYSWLPSDNSKYRPSLLSPGESHIDGDTYAALTFRDRFRSWSRCLPVRGGILPSAFSYLFVPFQIWSWFKWFEFAVPLDDVGTVDRLGNYYLELKPPAEFISWLDSTLDPGLMVLIRHTIQICVTGFGYTIIEAMGLVPVLAKILCGSHQNFVKFLMYNVWSELLGLATHSGALGLRLASPFQACWYFIKPGTVRTPLFQSSDAGHTRRFFPEVFLYMLVVGLLSVSLYHQPPITELSTNSFIPIPSELLTVDNWILLLLPFVFLGILGIFDVVAVLASRIEIYGYMLIGLGLVALSDWIDSDEIRGYADFTVQQRQLTVVQLVQSAVWFFAGVSKCGPWFTYVVPFMSQNNVLFSLLPAGMLRHLFRNLPAEAEAVSYGGSRGSKKKAKSPKRGSSGTPEFKIDRVDMRPSRLTHFLAGFGVAAEILIPVVLFITTQLMDTRANPILDLSFLVEPILFYTVCAATAFHVYILSQLPVAGVFHWNIATIILTWRAWGVTFLKGAELAKAPAPWSDLTIDVFPGTSDGGNIVDLVLAVFIWSALCFIPIRGNLFPREVPFMLSYRPYAGNWRWQFMVFNKSKVSREVKQNLVGAGTSNGASFEPISFQNSVGAFPFSLMKWDESCPNLLNQAPLVFYSTIGYCPAYRGVASVVEALESKLKWNPSDTEIIIGEFLATRILGFAFGYGRPAFQPSFRAGLRDNVGITSKDQCYLIQCEPIGLWDHLQNGKREVEMRCIDVGKEKVVWTRKVEWDDLVDVDEPADCVLFGVEREMKL